MTEEVDEPEPDALLTTTNEEIDDEMVEILAAEQDEDANLIVQFEDAVMDTLQSDAELAAFFTGYQEARRRLSERVKVRGFWPVQKKGLKGTGKKGKGKSKGKQSLAQRIANSYCRLCHRRGHWKAECPDRQEHDGNATSSKVAPTSFVTVDDLPMEMAEILMHNEPEVTCHQRHQVVLFGVTQGCSNAQGSQGVSLKGHPKWNKNRFQQGLRARLRYDSSTESCKVSPIDVRKSSSEGVARKVNSDTKINSEECETSFASTGTTGVVDLGASQSVIGNQQIPDLLKQLPSEVRQQIPRTNCSLTFRFGNHQTLESHHALLFPLLGKWFRVAVVKGNTPFLLSSKFLKETIGAVIDTVEGTMWSKVLNRHLPIELTVKNLYLLDINHLWIPESQSKQETFHVQQVQPETSNLETALNRVRGVVKSEHSENQTIKKDNDSDKVSDKIIKDPSPNSSDHKVSQEVTSQVSSFDAESPEEEGPKALLVSESIRESPSHHVHGQDVSGSKTQGLSFQAKPQDVIEQEEMKHIETMTLEELSKETIDFGKSKLGQTYTMAFSDQGWTSWFVSHYTRAVARKLIASTSDLWN